MTGQNVSILAAVQGVKINFYPGMTPQQGTNQLAYMLPALRFPPTIGSNSIHSRARIFKLSWSPIIDFQRSQFRQPNLCGASLSYI